MSYYWAGLDYAKWIFCAVGVGCFWRMNSEPVGRKRGWLKVAACCTLAVGIFCGGVAGVLFNRRAPHILIEGTLAGVQVQGGRGARTQFQIIQSTGESVSLSLDRAVRWIHDGDAVTVVYQEGSGAVLALTELSGPYVNSQIEGNDGAFGAWMATVAAVILAGYGILDWFNDGSAIPSEPNNQSMPDGDVDSASMLNLSRRE